MENVSVVFDNNGMPGKVICHGEEFNVADAVFCGKMEELGAYAYKIRLCITDGLLVTIEIRNCLNNAKMNTHTIDTIKLPMIIC